MAKIFVLAGPTASGKTDYALQFAQRNHCEILSCDAVSFYKNLDIGSAKPTKLEQSIVKHWGIDLVEANQYFCIQDYVTYAKNCVDDIFKRGYNVLVVGGSGFYLKSFFEPVVDNFEASLALQERLKDLEASQGIAGVFDALLNLNLQGFPKNFDTKNPQKLRKALLRCWTSGLDLLTLEERFKKQPKPFSGITKESTLLVWPLELLFVRAKKRIERMIRNGLIEEVEALLPVFQENHPATNAIGYRETIQYLKNKNRSTVTELAETIFHNTCHLIKKQNTWFRHQIKWQHYFWMH